MMRPVDRDQLAAMVGEFEKARPYLEAALAKDPTGTWDIDTIRDRYLRGDVQLWHGSRYAGITEVLNYPKRRVVLVHLAGGELDAILDHFEDLETFARIVGATGIEVMGREGWARVLKNRGFEKAAVRLFRGVE